MRSLGSALILITLSALVNGHDFSQNQLEILHPWSKPTPPISKYGVAYFTIKNTGNQEDILLQINVPPEVAESASLHDVLIEGDMMRMREVINGKLIPAASMVKFQPGGNHIMLEGLKRPLQIGDKFSLELIFENTGSIPIQIWVEGKDSPPPKQHKQHKQHKN